MELVKNERSWLIGTASDAAWLDALGTAGSGITAFDGSCRLNLPDDHVRDQAAHDQAVVRVLGAFGTSDWWLGYLEYGVGIDLVFDDAPRTRIFGWNYILAQAGAQQALSWRPSVAPDIAWKGALPDLIFPVDHSWILFTPWDDRWSFIGGPQGMVERCELDSTLGSRIERVPRLYSQRDRGQT